MVQRGRRGDRANTAYHRLGADISTFLTEVGQSGKWAQNGKLTDDRFTAIQTECVTLLAKGLMH